MHTELCITLCMLRLQAFGKGIGPFIENVTEPDFLQAVSYTSPAATPLRHY